MRWKGTLRRTHRSIRSTLQRVEASARVIDAAERFAPSRPAAAVQRLVAVAFWLADAADDLKRAARGLEETTFWIAIGGPTADATQQLVDGYGLWTAAAGRLVRVSNDLDATYARVIQTVAIRPRVAPNGCNEPSAIIIQTRAAGNAVAGARNISRGRAPPLT